MEENKKHLKRSKPLKGDQEALWLLPSIRPKSEVCVGRREPGVGYSSAVWWLSGSGQLPAISAAALHLLCFVRAAQVAAHGQGFQHPAQCGGSVINVKCRLSPFPLHLLQYLQFFLLKTHTSSTP